MNISNPKFKTGDKVYHTVPESEKGVIVDLCFYPNIMLWHYQVVFSATVAGLWYYEYELQTEKSIL